MGGARGRQTRALREAGRLRLPRHAPRRRAGPIEGTQDQARIHVPLRPGLALHARARGGGLCRDTPFIFNGYEQNSQWLDPKTPLRQVDHDADQSVLHVSSLEGYGAPIIDIGHLLVGSDLSQVVGTMRNFIPERMVRATGRMMRMNIDDGDIFIGEFANGALCSVQTSFVTVGNYPGIEARIYGSKAALICRLVEEHGICESLKVGDRGPGRVPRPADARSLLSARRQPARIVAHAVLRAISCAASSTEILSDGPENEGNFDDGAWVQEVINAVEQSFRERRWVSLPLA